MGRKKERRLLKDKEQFIGENILEKSKLLFIFAGKREMKK